MCRAITGLHANEVWLDQSLGEQSMSRAQLLVLLLCGSVLFIDGFDAQSMGFVAPALVQQLHLTRSALGPVFSSGLVGIMIGALVFGPLADRIGRKPVLVWCTLLFGVFSLLTATAGSLQGLLLYRLFTGFGLGGAMPNAVALTSEFMPERFRATAVTVMFVGFAIGAAAGGFVAAGLIPRFGWQSVFVTGGIAPCMIAVLLIVFLPESTRYLQTGNARTSLVTGRGSKRFIVGQLFDAGRTRMTLLIWVIFFMSLLDLYFLNAWMPTLVHDAGIEIGRAIVLTALFQLGGAVGSFVLGRVLDRFLSFRVLGYAYLAAGVFVFLIGTAGKSVVLLAWAIFAAGFAVIGGQGCANVLAAAFYPTPIRATGVGWALGIGRVGSIVGPLLGGVLLSLQQDTRRIFWAAAVPVLAASVAGFLASRAESLRLAEQSLRSEQDIITPSS
jgi:AAHS family 4-hydroxybenzoate transporter-like MFS transporter